MSRYLKINVLSLFICSFSFTFLHSGYIESEVGGRFKYVGALSEPRYLHDMTVLAGGNILVSGGISKHYKVLSSCELFDYQQNKFTQTASMKYSRYLHTATLLQNGKVLIVGGIGGIGAEKKLVSECELYDPVTRNFNSAGHLQIPREGHRAVLLLDGRVLIVGGGDSPNFFKAKGISEFEIYDPVTNKFEISGRLQEPRQFHTVTLLSDGQVLITGGSSGGFKATLSSAEIFNPKENKVFPISSMNDKRVGHTAVKLNDGRVLIAGGSDYESVPRIKSAEIFNPRNNRFILTGSLNESRVDMKGILLDDGTVLIAGGSTKGPVFHSSAEIYDPNTEKFKFTGSMAIGRDTFSAVKLKDGRILFAGGASEEKNSGGFKFLKLVESYSKELRINYRTPDFVLNQESNESVDLISMKENLVNNKISFSCDIQPILDNKCRKCHGFFADNLLDTYDELEANLLVIPGKATESKITKINEIGKENLSTCIPLSLEELNIITNWINQGALNN